MDVINFSGGGPQADPRTDAMIETVANVVRAGVVPIVSAGNDRDFFGLGTAGSPATAPDAIAVGATTNSHVFDASFSVVSPAGLGRIPFVPTDDLPQAWISGQPAARRRGDDPGREPAPLRGRASGGSLQRRDRARQPRRLPVPGEARSRARSRRGRHGRRGQPRRRSRVLDLPGRGRHDLRPRRREAPRGDGRVRRRGDGPVHAGPARGAHVVAGRPDELLGRRA